MRKKECEWEVIRLRARGEYLGVVKAADDKAALKAAINAFAIETVEERSRLLIRRARLRSMFPNNERPIAQHKALVGIVGDRHVEGGVRYHHPR